MNFQKAADTYRQNALVQGEMAQKLISLIPRGHYGKILEIGSGTGFLTDEIVKNLEFGELYLNDILENQTKHNSSPPSLFLKGDIQTLELPRNLDLIVSNAALQWMGDLRGLFKKIKDSSNIGSVLAFTTFGTRNFEQVNALNQGALSYFTLQEIEAMLEGWEIKYLEEEIKVLYFDTPREILKHIKATGVSTHSGGLWGKDRMAAFEKEYERAFSDANGTELTYHPVYCVAEQV